MKIPEPSDADKDRFRSMVPEHPSVEIKPMFDNLAAFVNGNMLMGLFGPDVGVKLEEPDRVALLAEPGAGRFGPADRPMKEYVSLPAAWEGSPEPAELWIHRALQHVAAMPPKVEKKKSPLHSRFCAADHPCEGGFAILRRRSDQRGQYALDSHGRHRGRGGTGRLRHQRDR